VLYCRWYKTGTDDEQEPPVKKLIKIGPTVEDDEAVSVITSNTARFPQEVNLISNVYFHFLYRYVSAPINI
jgi:hypothetical protein